LFVDAANLLTLSKEELQNLLPKASAPLIDFTDLGMTNSTNIDTTSLEQRLLEMADIIGRRESALKVLSTLSTVDITDNVMADIRSGTMDTKAMIEKYSTECMTQMEIISQSLTRQDPLLQEILADNEIFTKNRASDPITTETDKIIKNFEQSVTSSLNIYAQLNAGVTFYSNLQSKLTNLIQSVEDISYSQQLLRQEFENQLMHDFERSTQEQKDREYAQTIANEFAAANISPPSSTHPPTTYPPTTYPPTTYPPSSHSNDLASYPAVPGPTKPQKPLPSNVYAGAPITTPPFITPNLNSPNGYNASSGYNPNVQVGYPSIPSPSPQQNYSQNYNSPVSGQSSSNLDALHQKANRMSEMGFALHDCMNALTQNNGNEEAAITMLLSQPPQQYQQQQPVQQQYNQQPIQQQQYNQQQQPPPPPPATSSNNSMLNFLWKKP